MIKIKIIPIPLSKLHPLKPIKNHNIPPSPNNSKN
jgi:hypothetical protein